MGREGRGGKRVKADARVIGSRSEGKREDLGVREERRVSVRNVSDSLR